MSRGQQIQLQDHLHQDMKLVQTSLQGWRIHIILRVSSSVSPYTVQWFLMSSSLEVYIEFIFMSFNQCHKLGADRFEKFRPLVHTFCFCFGYVHLEFKVHLRQEKNRTKAYYNILRDLNNSGFCLFITYIFQLLRLALGHF